MFQKSTTNENIIISRSVIMESIMMIEMEQYENNEMSFIGNRLLRVASLVAYLSMKTWQIYFGRSNRITSQSCSTAIPSVIFVGKLLAKFDSISTPFSEMLAIVFDQIVIPVSNLKSIIKSCFFRHIRVNLLYFWPFR